MGTVMAMVREFDGSFSAEHGTRPDQALHVEKWRGGPELKTMRRIKAALEYRWES